MAFTENELSSILQRAGNLMTKEGQQKINQMSKLNANNYDSDGVYVNSQKHYTTNESVAKQKVSIPQSSKLPTAIVESLRNNPIDVDNMPVLDNLSIPTQKQMVTEQEIPQQQVYQQPVYQPQYMPMAQTIDYNYIRSIVNECVQANLKQIKEELLKESSLKVIRLNSDNKIQLIDNKNNLFESILEYKKNISKK